ncbi:MAG: M48 family metalloprotease [Planctomycetia bacterium]|nr:M48 family metalloprotease [Planctomycetia bacterium]
MSARTLFRWLLWCYIPFLLLVLALCIAFCAWLIWVFRGSMLAIVLLLPVFSLVLILFVIAMLAGWRMIFRKNMDFDEPNVLPLNVMALEPMGKYVRALAEKDDLPVPDRYELTIGDVASVYEDDDGKNVLRIDGLALACIPKHSLLAIIAHELAHYAGGDTRESRSLVRYGPSINQLEYTFVRQPWLLINPLTWIIRGYHQLLLLALFASSREQEYAADAKSAELLGAKEAAKALVLIEILHRVPWLGIESIGTSMAMHRSKGEQVFGELQQRMKSMSAVDWADAFAKAWKEESSLYHSHPTLKERVKALGVKRKVLMAELGKDTSPPLAMEMPLWHSLEKKLSDFLVLVFQQRQQDIADLQELIRRW